MTRRSKPTHTLGDAAIEPRLHGTMNALAADLDEILNGDKRGAARETGFVLLVFPFGEKEGRCNYISNSADLRNIVVMMKEQIARLEGQPEVSGRA